MLDRKWVIQNPDQVRRMLARRGLDLRWHYHVEVGPDGDRMYEGIAERCPLCRKKKHQTQEN